MPRDAIRVEGLEVSCVVGVNPDERDREQPLVVTVELGLGLERAGLSAELSATCDYARVAEEIAALLRFRRYRLLEVAAEELAAMLLAVHPGVEVARLRLDKPEALRGRARSAGVSIQRVRADFPRRRQRAECGALETVLATAEASLHLLLLEPQRAWATHPRGAHELVFRVRGELTCGGARMSGVSARIGSEEQAHEYRNEGTATATLFCCVHPRLLPGIRPA